MIERIHLDPKLEKCLEVLKKGIRRACLAADRAAGIIDELKRGVIPPGDICAFTRYGEGRIKGCRKYNLGAAYRLITLKQGNDLYLLFMGTHRLGRWKSTIRKWDFGFHRIFRRVGARTAAPPAVAVPPDDPLISVPQRSSVQMRESSNGVLCSRSLLN